MISPVSPGYAAYDPYATAYLPIAPAVVAPGDPYANGAATLPLTSAAAAAPTEYVAAPSVWAADQYQPSMLDALADAAANFIPEELARPLPPATAPAQAAAATAAAVSPAATGVATLAARSRGSELWAGVRDPRTVHVTQIRSRYNPNPTPGNRDCGPASVVMALRLVGLKIPGVLANATPQLQIDRARAMAKVAVGQSTSNHDLGRALHKAGAQTRELVDGAAVRESVLAGRPVILNGNPRNPGAYGHNFSSSRMVPFDGQHWIVVSGYDEATGQFIINDPLSKVGPVKVSPAALESYRAGSMGIEVSR